MAYYRKRSNGWRAEIAILGIRDSATWPTKAQAIAWATEIEARIRADHARGHHTQLPAKITVYELIHDYIAKRLPQKKGAEKEGLRLTRFSRELTWVGEYASSITQQHIATWRDGRLTEVQPSSVNRELNLLSALFAHAVEIRACTINPVRGLRRPRNPPARDRDISQAEIDAMLTALDYQPGATPTKKIHYIAMAMLFAMETGMRAGEITELAWDRVLLEQRYITLLDTKNGDSRQVPLSTAAINILNLLPRAHGPCFAITAASLDTLWRRARKRAAERLPSVVDLHFHDTRHAAVTRLANRLDVLALARMIGHRDIKSLMIYYNPSASQLAQLLG
ncbi:tyrosine-type recombinase/integrase [Rivihabitans pingtungensis]|uniref:Site-specific recombinase XerD n=1 Tax=Rivihabitans pingtungensis TaxID=1054498 RepID=A0A318KR77_9NEIS|nr:site-specific integrase [Rivihabitans pingtungensis]PXX79122.1 site-specific recombinase XerD [Rivihabitans pingtungensis]